MLIGELPRGYDPTKYDDVIFSKDGVHLLRIPYQEFIKGVGGGGRGLLYWKETKSQIYNTILDISKADSEEYLKCSTQLFRCNPANNYEINAIYLKRENDNTVIGGIGNWQYWSQPSDRQACDSNPSYHRYPFMWPLLASLNEDDVKLYITDSSGTTVGELIEPTTFQYDGRTWYINGGPTPDQISRLTYRDHIYGEEDVKIYDYHDFIYNGVRVRDVDMPKGIQRDQYYDYWLNHHFDRSIIDCYPDPQPAIKDVNMFNYLGWMTFAIDPDHNTDVGSGLDYPIGWGLGTRKGSDGLHDAIFTFGNITVQDFACRTAINTGATEEDPYIFYGGILPADSLDTDPPPFHVKKNGEVYCEDAYVKVDDEYINIKELSPDPEDLIVTRLKNYTYDPSTEQTTRMTNLNIWTNDNMVHFVGKAASSGVTGGPPADAHVIHIPWDNNSDALGVQIAIAHGSNPRLYIRAQGSSSDSWSNWFMVPRLGGQSMAADKVLCSGPNSTILLANVSSTEVEHLSGVTSNVQQQLNEKSAVSVTEYTQSGEHIADIIVNGTTHAIYAPTGGGGGGSSYHILTGTAAPLDTQGENGDLYLQKASGIVWRYIKFEITKHKTTNNYTQLTELQFLDSSNKAFNFQGSNAWSNQPHYTATDGPTSMIDGVIRNDSKALWVCSPTAANPITAIIESRVPLDLSIYSKIRLITGGDAEARDPSTWTISVSNDQQNWILINSETDYVMTSTRLAVGYEGTAILPDTMQPMIIQRYYKDSGHWIPIYN